MAEQQYRVIADKHTTPDLVSTHAAPGDRLVYDVVDADRWSLIRIERPMEDAEPSVQSLTREQIAEARAALRRAHGELIYAGHEETAGRVYAALALFPQPTPSAVVCTECHEECGARHEHRSGHHDVDPVSIVDMAPGTEHPRARPIGVIARQIVHDLLADSDSDDIALWEDYPEIGENDWDEVIAAARALAPAAPSDTEYRAAYAALNPSRIRDVTPPPATHQDN